MRRAAAVAEMMADAGLIALACLISPYAAGRAAARRAHQAAGLTFVEVYVATPLAECRRRDPKGLYARAGAGQLSGLTGLDAPYEAPPAPDLRLSGHEDLGQAVDKLVGVLDGLGVLGAPAVS